MADKGLAGTDPAHPGRLPGGGTGAADRISPWRAGSPCRSWRGYREDQVFVAAFLKSHGSIKEMEQVFGVSYPTVKARLNRIAGQLEFVETDPKPRAMKS